MVGLRINSGTSSCLNRGFVTNKNPELKWRVMISNPKAQPFSVKVLMRGSSALVVLLLVVLTATAGVALIQRARRAESPAQRNGSVVQLDRNGNLQRALDDARPGDTIVLEAGAVYKGPFTLPIKSGNQFITIQSKRL